MAYLKRKAIIEVESIRACDWSIVKKWFMAWRASSNYGCTWEVGREKLKCCNLISRFKFQSMHAPSRNVKYARQPIRSGICHKLRCLYVTNYGGSTEVGPTKIAWSQNILPPLGEYVVIVCLDILFWNHGNKKERFSFFSEKKWVQFVSKNNNKDRDYYSGYLW